MLKKRIKKHTTILSHKFHQNKELERLENYTNQFLKIIRDAFKTVKESNYEKSDIEAFNRCEVFRKQLLKDETLISFDIFGSKEKKTLVYVCQQATSGRKWCEFLYQLAKNINAPVILEIGTSVGLSGNYILEAIKDLSPSFFVTLEGIPQLCDLAFKRFSSITSNDKFEIKQGLYDITFPQLMHENKNFNLLFIDGNHKKDPTLEYFKKLKTISQSPSVFIFDDINWSSEMSHAWEIIKMDNDVNYYIDLYKWGIVICDKNEIDKNIGFKLHLTY